ncbi:MAG: hypothetical protein Q8N51_00660 [Gammaproteobacteria bacterium]|nr:hypothetical protein [Gammaproteobacteria bacterium]
MDFDIERNPAVVELEEQTKDIVTLTETYQVTTVGEYNAAGEDLKRVKAQQKAVEATRTAITQPINASLKKINEFFAKFSGPLATAEQKIKSGMVGYDQEQEKLRREAQRKLDEEAAAERRKIEAAAAEARRKAQEEEDRLRKEAQVKRDAEAKARREAEEAERAGNRAAAEAARIEADRAAKEAAKLDVRADIKLEKAESKAAGLELQAAAVVAPLAQADTAKVSGISGRDNWHAECTDLKALVAEVAAGRASLALLQANEKVITAQAKSLKQDFVVPGVRVWMERGLAARSA